MKHIELTKLKRDLSRVLELVKSGEALLVKDRGRPIAQIDPISPTDEQWVALLIRDGVLLAPKYGLTNAKLAEAHGGLMNAIAIEMMEQDYCNIREFAKEGFVTDDEIMRWLSREFEGKRWVHTDRILER